MLGLLIVLLIQAVLLKVAVGVVGPGEGADNTLGRAFVVAALLAVVSGVLGWLHIPGILGAIAWLALVKGAYDIGWMRAVGVWLALVVVSVVAGVLLAMAGVVVLGALLVVL